MEVNTKNIKDIINDFNKFKGDNKTSLELELRFNINDYKKWKSIYEEIIMNNTESIIETSIIVALPTESNIRKRKEIYFQNGEKIKEVYTIKENIARIEIINDDINYRLSLASEKNTDKFDISDANLIRIRFRSSIIIDEWKIDFTFVKTLKNTIEFQKLSYYKDKIFVKNSKIITSKTYLNFINTLLLNESSKNYEYELEAEFIGKNINEDNIYKIKNVIFELLKKKTVYNQNYNKYMYMIAKLLLIDQDKIKIVSNLFENKFGLKQFANAPITLTYETYLNKILPKIDQFYLSDKADGERCYIFITNKKIMVISIDNIIDLSDFIYADTAFDKLYFNKNTILDVEVINIDYKNKKFDRIYVFDILMLNDIKLTQENMDKRNDIIDSIIKHMGKHIQKKILIRLYKEEANTQIENVYNRASRLYPIDGLIFTPNFSDNKKIKYNQPENYFDMNVYKWKPPEQMTIDLLSIKCPNNLLGIEPYNVKEGFNLYLLFCGIRDTVFNTLNMKYIKNYREIFSNFNLNKKYFPIQFSPSINSTAYIYYHPLNSEFNEQDINYHICEFVADTKFNWKIKKLRKDKDADLKNGTGYGNDFKIAETIYSTYNHPFTFEMLINPQIQDNSILNKIGSNENSYFQTQKKEIYIPLTKFNAFVKAQLIRQLENSEWITDLASGKGQDLFVYNGFNIKNGLFLEIDKLALEELNRRKYEFGNDKFYVYNKKPINNMNVYTKNIDLTINYEEIINEIKDINGINKMDGVIINFALHYIIKDNDSLDNFINLVDKLLKPGGIFILTCFNGESIHKLLENIEYNNSWDIKERNILKYSIKKLYDKDIENYYGMKISVIHPFSNGEYYEENLLNISNILKRFNNKGYVIRQRGSFGDWINKFKNFNPKLYNKMSENDIFYSSLYEYISLWKSIN